MGLLYLLKEVVLLLPVFRFRCPSCGLAFSLLPSFSQPHHQAAVEVKEAIVAAYEEGEPIAKIADASRDYAGGGYSEKAIRRWRKGWQQLREAHEPALWAMLFHHGMDAPLPRERQSPWKALQAALPGSVLSAQLPWRQEASIPQSLALAISARSLDNGARDTFPLYQDETGGNNDGRNQWRTNRCGTLCPHRPNCKPANAAGTGRAQAMAAGNGKPRSTAGRTKLEESGATAKGQIAPSTLSRHLRSHGMSRKQLVAAAPATTFRRFEAHDILELLQSDFKHFVYLPDPQNPKKVRKTILLAILDDYSCYCVHAQIYWDEKLPRLEDSLKKAMLKHGIPETFYCDNGSAYSAHHLARICGRLGIRLTHSLPYRPMGRGKVERLFQFVDSSFRPEVQALILGGEVGTLEQLNAALRSWLDGYYHVREHGSTKQPPKERFEASQKPRKRLPLVELNELFLWEETRKADKTGCIRLDGNLYEVDSDLVCRTVALRYDPFDLSHVQVLERAAAAMRMPRLWN